MICTLKTKDKLNSTHDRHFYKDVYKNKKCIR